jgi:polar amino acid transport system permease protein
VVTVLRLLVDALRSVPPLALVLLVFFGLPSVGLTLSAYWVLWLTLSAILAAFAEEIYWAGISAVGQGQWEASRSTGLGYGQTLRHVVLPQAFKLCVPPLTNRAIAITKNTALGTAIGMPELLNEAQTAVSFSGNASPLILAALGYLLIFLPLMMFASGIEKRMRWGGSR